MVPAGTIDHLFPHRRNLPVANRLGHVRVWAVRDLVAVCTSFTHIAAYHVHPVHRCAVALFGHSVLSRSASAFVVNRSADSALNEAPSASAPASFAILYIPSARQKTASRSRKPPLRIRKTALRSPQAHLHNRRPVRDHECPLCDPGSPFRDRESPLRDPGRRLRNA